MNEQSNHANCYNSRSWLDYHAGRLSEAECLAMEEHLLECDSCLEIYLQVAANKLRKVDAPALGADFTDQVMGRIAQEKPKPISSVPVLSRTKIFVSYCAAASIAMFFWVGGYFDQVSDSLEKGMERSAQLVETRIEPLPGIIQTGWTQKVLDNQGQLSFLKKIIKEKE